MRRGGAAVEVATRIQWALRGLAADPGIIEAQGRSPLREALREARLSADPPLRLVELFDEVLQLCRAHPWLALAIGLDGEMPEPLLLGIGEHADKEARTVFSRNERTPCPVLRRVVRHVSTHGLEQISAHPNSPPDVLTYAFEFWERHLSLEVLPDDDERRRQQQAGLRRRRRRSRIPDHVAIHPHCPEILLQRLSRHPSAFIRCHVASNRAIPIEILEALGSDCSPDVRGCVASHPRTPATLLQGLWRGELAERAGVAQNPSAPRELLRVVFEDPDHQLRAVLTRNRGLPSEWFDELAKDADWLVRSGAASSPYLSPATLRALGQDPFSTIRSIVAAHPKAPPDLLSMLTLDDSLETAHAAMANPNVPPDRLREICSNGPRDARQAVAYTTQHRDLLELLAQDSELNVRRSVARNVAAPPSVLSVLAAEGDPGIAADLAQNPGAPPVLLGRLARKALESVDGHRAPVEGGSLNLAWIDENRAKACSEWQLDSLAENPTTLLESLVRRELRS